MAIDQGMNIAEVEALGATLRQSADNLDRFASILDTLVKSAAWQGPTAIKFKTQWWPQHRTRLRQIQSDVRGFSQSALNNAGEQRKASDSAGSSVAGPSGVSSDRLSAITEQAITARPPAEVLRWWDSLSTTEQDAIVAQRPEIVGNLDGVPPEVRYQANRLVIQAHIDDLRAHGASQSAIQRFEDLLSNNRQILLFDPSGDGRIAEVFGNITTADDIAVVVPGIGTSLRNYSSEYAVNLHKAARGDTATIMWLGYDTPAGPNDHHVTDPSAAFTARATEWAPTLATFTAGLRTSGYAEISIVAHSYGTVLATEAAKVGMSVDRVIMLGSPGVSATDASVFNGAEVFAAKNFSDYVPPLSPLGTDPTSDGFGAKVFNANAFNPINRSSYFDHSSYFTPGSTVLDGIVRAVESSRTSADGLIMNRYVHEDGSADDVWTGTF